MAFRGAGHRRWVGGEVSPVALAKLTGVPDCVEAGKELVSHAMVGEQVAMFFGSLP